MSTPVSIKDVAARAGVSVGTVSNVLNRPDLVAERTQERVRKAIDELSFVRNEWARQLRAGRSRMIGLVVLDIGNPFYTDVARGAEAAAEQAGLAVMLCSSDEQVEKESRYLALLEEQRVQGVLISPLDVTDRRLVAIRKRGTPVVMVDRTSRSKTQCSVSVDDVEGGRLALDHLLQRGHRRIAFVGGPLSLQQVADRYAGAQQSAERKRGVRLVHVPTPDPTVASGKEAGARIADMAHGTRHTAVFCANDLLALGVLQEMTARGLRVPEDLAIVGYDDIDFAAAAAVPLSSVRQPRDLIGRTAAELLIEECAGGPHKHRQVVYRPELIVRASSA